MLRSFIVALLIIFSGSAGAQGTQYNYIQGSFGRVDLDGSVLDVDGDGLGASGSFSIDDNFHVFGEYQTADVDFGIDVAVMEGGVGYHTDMTPRLGINANLGYLKIKADTPVGSTDEDGLFMGLGLRGIVGRSVELYGGLDYIDFDDSDSEVRANAGFLLSLTETFGVGLKASFWDDVNIFQITARVYFE